ncbi:hypothetical protein NLJ89_g3429 [Agrocybe chaxingu]|uniref:F-box domain-containing protein n=1 Tax=Agrocybe chaxingu TaxID=84603 RepID=A0A9W8MVI0_9AGAR|nr:hypothetical protein NLJ89_g3429 [Agrocybe chaxingu]
MSFFEALLRLSIAASSHKPTKETFVETLSLEPVPPTPRPVNHGKPSVCQRNLPRRILAEIFKIICKTPWTFSSDCEGGRALPPVALSQVCSGWRRVALTTPVLWSCIHVSLPIHPALNPFLLEEWSKRAGSGPSAGLYLFIAESKSRQHHRADYGRSLQALLPLLHNCSTIEIDLPSRTSLTTLILSYLRGHTQCNPTAILGTGTAQETRKRHAFLLNRTQSSLTTSNILQWQWNLFRTDSGHATNDLRGLAKNGLWTHITHVDLYDPIDLPTFRNLLHAMHRGTKVQSLHVWSLRKAQVGATSVVQHKDKPIPQSFYKFDNLHSLTLYGTDQFGPILSNLILPSLRRLEFSYGGSEEVPSSEVSAFNSFLARSHQHRIQPNCYLHSLTLSFMKGVIDESTLSDFLTSAHLSRLSTLNLTADISEKIVNLLAARRGLRSIFMPNLRDIHLNVCTARDSRLSSMVSFRCNAPGPGCLPLKRVDIVAERAGKVDQAEFKKMFEQGLDGMFWPLNRRHE